MADEIATYVDQMYQKELGRGTAGDPASQAWVDALSSGALSREAFVQALNRSEEGSRFDINTGYKNFLDRTPDAGGLQGWSAALQSGQLDQNQFFDAIRNSDEYKAKQAALAGGASGGTQTGTTTPFDITKDPTFIKMQEENKANGITIANLQAQIADLTKNPVKNQMNALQTQANANADKGLFEPSLGAGGGGGGAAAAPAPVAQAIAPTQQMYVPQTYLAPPPPQYRGISPFTSPFTAPFESYYNIAMRRRPYPYPGQTTGTGTTTGTAADNQQPYSPFPYYPGYYGGYYGTFATDPMGPTATAPATSGSTTTTTPTT